MNYTHKTYGTGFAIRVNPSDRGADVLHYIHFGNLLGGRPLDGVEWKEVTGEEYNKIQEGRSKALMRSMRITD